MVARSPPERSRYASRPAPKRALRELLEATLNWAHGGVPDRQLQVAGIGYRLTHLADGAAGAAALLCEAPPGARIPEYLERRRIRALTGGSAGRHLMIFTDTAHSTLVWSWVTSGALGTRAYRELSFTPGQAWGPLRPVLESIAAGSPPPPAGTGSRPRGGSSGACAGAEVATGAKRPSARALLAAVTEAVAAGGSARSSSVQLIQDLIEGAEEAGTIRDQWAELLRIRIFDRTCGRGKRLERALDVLVLAYEAMIERMRSAVDDLGRRRPAPRPERLGDLAHLVRRSGGGRDPAALERYCSELALLHNLFGMDHKAPRITECRARLVRRLGEATDPDLLALNIRVAGASGGADERTLVAAAARAGAHPTCDEDLDLVLRGHRGLLAMHMDAEVDLAALGAAMAAADRRLAGWAGPLVPAGHLIQRLS